MNRLTIEKLQAISDKTFGQGAYKVIALKKNEKGKNVWGCFECKKEGHANSVFLQRIQLHRQGKRSSKCPFCKMEQEKLKKIERLQHVSNERHNGRYTVLEDKGEFIRVNCKEHDQEFDYYKQSFHKGYFPKKCSGCRDVSKKQRSRPKHTIENLQKFSDKTYGEIYKIKETYTDPNARSRRYLIFDCLKHSNLNIKTSLRQFKINPICSSCSSEKKEREQKQNEKRQRQQQKSKLKEELNQKYPNRYRVQEVFMDKKLMAKVKCKHDNVLTVGYHQLLRGVSFKCKECAFEIRSHSAHTRLTDQELEEKLLYSPDTFIRENYSFIERTDIKYFYWYKVKLHCNEHNTVFLQTTNDLGKIKSCPGCKSEMAKVRRLLPDEELKSRAQKKLNKFNHSRLFTVTDVKRKTNPNKAMINLKCNVCLISFWKELYKFDQIKECPNCNPNTFESRGEVVITNYLWAKGIVFEKQRKFEKLKYKGALKADFYIPKKNLIIEFDGEQHSQPIKIFGGKQGLEVTKKRDELKDKYAVDNNLHMLRIRYDKILEIPEIIEKKLEEIR